MNTSTLRTLAFATALGLTIAPAGAASWVAKAPMPTARQALCAVTTQGVIGTTPPRTLIFALGGSDQKFHSFNTVEAYDPVTDKWFPRRPMPQKRTTFAAAAAAGKIFVFGGDPSMDTYDIYDPIADGWQGSFQMKLLGSNASISRYQWGGATIRVNGKDLIALVGGARPGTGNPSNKIILFDPISRVFTEMADSMPVGVQNHAVCAPVRDNNLFVIGGNLQPQSFRRFAIQPNLKNFLTFNLAPQSGNIVNMTAWAPSLSWVYLFGNRGSAQNPVAEKSTGISPHPWVPVADSNGNPTTMPGGGRWSAAATYYQNKIHVLGGGKQNSVSKANDQLSP